MSLQIGDEAPDFSAETTLGLFRFPAGRNEQRPHLRLVKQPG